MPRGGRRPGAGRKPKTWGGIVPRAPVALVPAGSVVGAPAVVEPIERFEPVDVLTTEERQVWDRQASHAFDARTLTRATALAFARYCRVVVLEAKEAASSARGGANHRGLLQVLNALETQFLLAPGKRAKGSPAAAGLPQAGALARFRS